MQLYALPQESQVTRHVCVEGWSMIGKWSGTPLRVFLERIGADTTARYVGVRMRRRLLREHRHGDGAASADADGVPAFRRDTAAKYGYPFKIRMPTKLGFKNPKFVTTIYVTDRYPRGYWTDRGYNWFSGI